MVRRAVMVLALLAGLMVIAPASHAQARVTISNSNGDAVADPTYATTVTVRGSGFQSIRGGHGGVYVVFGTVDGSWRPSQGGQTGRDYFYVPDSEDKDNQGFQRYVAFPGSDTASSANGGSMTDKGSWSTSMVIPGQKFNAVDRSGKSVAIDCAKVTCGIITFGAHGVVNANNETFTPITFRDLHAGGTPATGGTTGGTPTTSGGTTGGTAGGTTGGTSTPTTSGAGGSGIVALEPGAAGATPVVTVDRATAFVGRVLSFTATGFAPGEQVVATFDDGLAGVGPLPAGPNGEVAGVLQLPADTRAGTHVLRLTGAASAAMGSESFPIAPAPNAVTAQEDETEWAPLVFMGVALLVFVGACVTAVVQWRRRRAAALPEAHHAV